MCCVRAGILLLLSQWVATAGPCQADLLAHFPKPVTRMRPFSRLLHSARPSACVSVMSSPVTASPRVAVVGGGLAGLTCASELQGAGIAAHVFDMGSRGPGQLPV